MDLVTLLISLVSGAAGGNVAGAAAPDKSLGTLWNSVAGLVGGGLGGHLLQMLGVLGTQAAAGAAGAPEAAGNIDIASILANIAGSGVGGGVLTLVIGILKDVLAKK